MLVLAGCGSATDTGTQTEADPETADVVTSGECANEEALVRRALDSSRLRADVDGDGLPDTVAVAAQPDAAEPCRAFVAVRVRGGSTYSTHLIAEAAPLEGLGPLIVGLPYLAEQPGAQIVVDTRAAVDSLLAQMFTLDDERLRAVDVPQFEDGTFVVEGGGVIYPHGAACTADGQLLLTEAAQTRDGQRFRVTRRTYDVVGEPVRFADPVVDTATVPVDALIARFPEFGAPHWDACNGRQST
ncbi:MAG TPA: hypothetical protein VLB29_11925 [Nocardioidaceae bacterium]|nr:hypothetical protein [Nocardioidaceae bacterium]